MVRFARLEQPQPRRPLTEREVLLERRQLKAVDEGDEGHGD